MSTRRHRRSALGLAIIGVLSLGGGVTATGAGAAPVPVGHAHVVRTAGGEVFAANRSDTFTLHFAQPEITVHSGDSVTFVHGDRTHDPHSVSLAAAGQLPHSSDPCPICSTFQAAHFPHGQNGPPKLLVDLGKPGFNQPGDSVLWMAGRTTIKVTAIPGTVLHYFCLIHPWMQGTIHIIR